VQQILRVVGLQIKAKNIQHCTYMHKYPMCPIGDKKFQDVCEHFIKIGMMMFGLV
jgi:hypothetical protein